MLTSVKSISRFSQQFIADDVDVPLHQITLFYRGVVAGAKLEKLKARTQALARQGT